MASRDLNACGGSCATSSSNPFPVRQVKEYTIALEVFDRSPNYNPKVDAIVRVEARRLRARLSDYYSDLGARDTIRIELPIGSYVPVIRAATGGSNSPASPEASIEHLEGLPMACSSEEQSLRSDAAAHTPGPGGTASATVYRLGARFVRSFDAQKCAALARKLAKNHTWVVPNLSGLDPASYLPQQANPKFQYIPGLLLGLWNADPDKAPDETALASRRSMFQEDLDIVRLLRRSGVSMMTGTDSPAPGMYPGFSVHDDLAWLVRAGLTPAEALRAATLNPALFLNLSDRLGSVAERKLADLVLLDGNPLRDIRNTTRIRAIIADGRLFDRATLDRVLQALARK